MTTGTRRQITIAQTMLLVAAIALVLGIAMTPGFAPILGMVVIPSTVGGVAFYLFGSRLVELVAGQQCPACRVRGMERRGLVSFGERYFLCRSCGVRCRRNLLGFGGTFHWKDASGPEYAAFYDKPASDDPWNAPPGLEDDDERGLFSKTHLNLVRNKRRRTPESPNGPGLE